MQMNNEQPAAQKETLLQKSENWENWRKKSLNSNPMESYSVPLAVTQPVSTRSTPLKDQQESEPDAGPVPKLIKINEKIFCLLLNNSLTLFQYRDEEERLAKKQKNTFSKNLINHIPLPGRIKWILGDNSDRLYIGGTEQIIVLRIEPNLDVNELWRKKFSHIKAFSFLNTNLRNQLLVLTSDKVYTYSISSKFELLRQLPTHISKQSTGLQSLKEIDGISIIIESPTTFYFVGTSIETKASARKKLGKSASTNQTGNKKCEVLYVTQFNLNKESADGRIFIIDYIFEVGIFKKVKAFQLGAQTFILALYEEVIVIKRNFTRFMVWDNVSVVSSKGAEKKGQLVLAEKRIMIYRQFGDIHAFELFFDFGKAKFETPKIDSFRGNDNDEDILYEALIFEYKPGVYMKILYYFKREEIYMPNQKYSPNTENGPKENMIFQLVCIQQTEPTQKLKELFILNKTPEEIDSFVRRFQISQVKVEKSKWEVSDKGIKEIQSLLMTIKDNDYIQNELTSILKKKSHDLNFLLVIERNQIDRYRKMLAEKLLKVSECDKSKEKIVDKNFNLRQIEEIKLVIQWLLESKMFEKKLQYSQNFLSFKEYDFIDLGKLKAASLREEIKLLGCKGFEKRLKYFFNSFKYLVLDDFRHILRFVISDLSEFELKQFFTLHFEYILPRFKQTDDEDLCLLWEDTFDKDHNQIQTKALFKAEVENSMNLIISMLPKNYSRIPLESALESFDQYFSEFMESEWFLKNGYRQHSLLSKSKEELRKYFNQLKEFDVCNIIVEVMYEKINSRQYEESKVKDVIACLKKENLFDGKYTQNLEARIKTYEFVSKVVKMNRKEYYEFELPPKSQFIILKEGAYFDLLFQNFKKYLLLEIRAIYEQFSPGFFVERFRTFLHSQYAILSQVIEFFDFMGDCDDVKEEVFVCTTKLLKLCDEEHTRLMIEKLMDREIVTRKGQVTFQQPIEEANIVFGELFINFFKRFQIDANYSSFLEEIEVRDIKDTTIYKQIIRKYGEQYDEEMNEAVEFKKNELSSEHLPSIQLQSMLQFTAFLLYFKSIVGMKISDESVIGQLIQSFMDYGKFEQIKSFISQVQEFGIIYDDRILVDEFPHYQLLDNVRKENNLKKILEDKVFEWVRNKERHIAKFETIEMPEEDMKSIKEEDEKESQEREEEKKKSIPIMEVQKVIYEMENALKLLNSFQISERLTKSINYLELLVNLKYFEPMVCLKVIKRNVNYAQTDEEKLSLNTSFFFMMQVLREIKVSKFEIRSNEEFTKLIEKFEIIHKDFVKTFQGNKNEEVIVGQFCRFNAELVVYLTQHRLFRPAAFTLFYLFNSTYYYRDVFFYFIGRAMSESVSYRDIEDIVYNFMTIEDFKTLEYILNDFVTKFNILDFVDEKLLQNNVRSIFKAILMNNQLDEAFFYLVRNTQVGIPEMEKLCLSLNKYPDFYVYTHSLLIVYIRAVKKYGESPYFPSFSIFKSKLSILSKSFERMDLIKDIFILISQMKILLNSSDQKQKKEIENDVAELNCYYEKFMANLEKGATRIKISLEHEEVTATRLRKPVQDDDEFNMPETKLSKKNSDYLPAKNSNYLHTSYKSQVFEKKEKERGKEYMLNEEAQKILEHKKMLRENEKRLKEIEEQNQELLKYELQPMISEARRKMEQKYALINKEDKEDKEDKEGDDYYESKGKDSLEEKKNELNELNAEQEQKIGEVKGQYKSKLVEETYEMLEELRKRRARIREETAKTYPTQEELKSKKGKVKFEDFYDIRGSHDMGAKGSMKSYIESPKGGDLKNSYYAPRQSHINLRPENSEIGKAKESFMNNSYYFGNKGSEFYVPKRQLSRPMMSMSSLYGNDEKSKKVEYLDRIKSQVFSEKDRKSEHEKGRRRMSLEEVREKMASKEPNTTNHLQKMAMIKMNSRAAIELMGNIFTACEQIMNFVEFVEDLLENVELTSQILEPKACKVIRQANKINRSNLPLKQIFTPNFFTSIHYKSMRDYYNIAYGIIKPNLIKIMEDPSFTGSVNGLAAYIRFGFGSDNSFSSKVYEDYTRALLNYMQKNKLSQSEINRLIERVRNNFANLEPGKRKVKLQQIINEIQDSEERKEFLQCMRKNLEGKSSMVSRDSIEEFQGVIEKMLKDA